MRAFLYDYHLLDGVFKSQRINDEYEKNKYYQALFIKHGISKAEFDSSIVYYTKNPKKFERVYVYVNKNLADLKEDVEAGKYFPIIPDSIKFKPEFDKLWTGDSIYFFTADSTLDKLFFTIQNKAVLSRDTYYFNFRLRAFSKDTMASTAYSTFKIYYANGEADSIYTEVLNDSILRRYKYTITATKNFRIDSLSGQFYASDQLAKTFIIAIDSIDLKRKYIPALRDSIEMQLDTVLISLETDSLPTTATQDSATVNIKESKEVKDNKNSRDDLKKPNKTTNKKMDKLMPATTD